MTSITSEIVLGPLGLGLDDATEEEALNLRFFCPVARCSQPYHFFTLGNVLESVK